MWSYSTPLQPGDFFYLWDGPDSYTFTNKINVGPVFSYEIDRTNWSETYSTHFYAVTLSRTNVESDFSGQVRYPLYTPDRVTLSWSSTNFTTVWSSTNMRTWSTVAMVSGTNSVSLNRLLNKEFFKLSRFTTNKIVETPQIKVWNPLNEPP